MRTLFWVAAAVEFVVFVYGMILTEVPLSQQVTGLQLAQWYGQAGFTAALLGLLVALGAFALAVGRLRNRPGEPATAFLSGVAGYGFAAAMVTLAVAALAGICAAGWWSFLPEFSAPRDRIALIVPAWRFWAAVAAGGLVAHLVFAALSRVRNWGGQYALFPPGRTPQGGDKA